MANVIMDTICLTNCYYVKHLDRILQFGQSSNFSKVTIVFIENVSSRDNTQMILLVQQLLVKIGLYAQKLTNNYLSLPFTS